MYTVNEINTIFCAKYMSSTPHVNLVTLSEENSRKYYLNGMSTLVEHYFPNTRTIKERIKSAAALTHTVAVSSCN